MPDHERRIGIYWIHDGRVVGVSCTLQDAEVGVPGLLDSPYTHVDAWSSMKNLHHLPRHLDYDALPRGRVMYQRDCVFR